MSMIVNKSYRVRLYPNQKQEQSLIKIIGACRFVWNKFLEQRKNHYITHKKNLSYAVMARQLTTLRHEVDWLSEIQAEPLQQSLRRLDTAYNSFFRKQNCFPNFKSKKDLKQSFQKHQDWKIKGNKIQIQKDLIVRFRGNIGSESELGTLIVYRVSTGKWYASITGKVNVVLPKRYTKPIGIDVGLETLATISTGKKYQNIQPQKTLQERLTKLQRSLARKKLGSNRKEEAKFEVARIYEKIRNIRENHLHKISHNIVGKNHATIVVEDLNVNGMMRNRHLARAIADASMSELLRQIKYKQEWKGGKFVKIDRFFPSSKTCSSCNFIVDSLPLSVRKWKCPKCKKNHDRDINAAKVILIQGLAHSPRREGEKVAER